MFQATSGLLTHGVDTSRERIPLFPTYTHRAPDLQKPLPVPPSLLWGSRWEGQEAAKTDAIDSQPNPEWAVLVGGTTELSWGPGRKATTGE